MGACFLCTEVEGFDSHTVHSWAVSVAVNASLLHSEDRGFESLTAHLCRSLRALRNCPIH